MKSTKNHVLVSALAAIGLMAGFSSSYGETAPLKAGIPAIIGYYSNSSPYAQFRPYQVTGSMSSTTGQRVTNVDFDKQLQNLNILAYAFMEVYPDGVSGPIDPNQVGKVYFSDPWSDLYLQDAQSPGSLCNASNVGTTAAPGVNYTLCFTTFANQGKTIIDPNTYQNSQIYSLYKMGNFSAFSKIGNYKLVSIGGWAHEAAFEKGAFVNPDNFVNSIMNVINTFGLDGVDLDYEPGANYTAANAAKLVDLTHRLRVAFDNKGWNNKIITTAVFASIANIDGFNGPGGKAGNWSKLAAYVNYIAIMGYDFHGGWDAGKVPTDFHSNLDVDPNNPNQNDLSDMKAVNAFINYGVAPAQLVLGVPSYGQMEAGAGAGNAGLYQAFTTGGSGDMGGTTESYYGIVGKLLGQGYTDHAILKDIGLGNNKTIAVWAYNPAAATFISYDNTQAIDTKAAYIQAKGLGGGMMWQLNSDISPADPNDASLLCHLARGLWGSCKP